ncbi:response regulator transcription factor [uncultured Paenibacillus sp.]|uniref:response regulator transcription factor n=1 Tax=uncultured Paenibacillus sp. TaxID=227322 RepID=UPI0015AA6AB6|nr:response regulator transcription factor [uncultured Paenibacillus sp.]
MKRYIMLVLEDAAEAERMKTGLEEAGYRVGWKQNGAGVLRLLEEELPDLLLLGTDITDDTSTVLQEEIGRFAPFPIILLLKEWSTEAVVAGFVRGANDVVQVTIPMAELYARIGHLISLFKRLGDGYLTELSFEDLRMELRSRKAWRDEEPIKLTPKEFDLLLFLMKRAGKVCGREMILQQVWGYDFATGTNVVDVYIRHLRKKIDSGHSKKLLHTIRGTGYMLG